MNYFDRCRLKFTTISGCDMPDEEYFKVPAVSTSRLKLLHPEFDGSMERYKKGFDQKFNSSLFLGSCVHNKILSPDEYIISDYTGKPSGKQGIFIEKLVEMRKNPQTKKNAVQLAAQAADYYANSMTEARYKTAMQNGLDYYKRLYKGEFDRENNDGKIVMCLDVKQYETWKRCVTNLTKHHRYRQIVEDEMLSFYEKEHMNEIAIFSDLEVTFPDGEKEMIKYKGKLDSVVIDHQNKIVYLNDIKTTSKSLSGFMGHVYNDVAYNGTFEHHFYYGQVANYTVLLQKYLEDVKGYNDYEYRCNIFAVQTTGENVAEVFPINRKYIEAGIKEFKELICRLAYYRHYGREYVEEKA